MKEYIEKCLRKEDLSIEEAAHALDCIMTNKATDIQIAGLLVALRAKGESVEELVGFARTMREHSIKINVDDENAIDVCGTGGDGLGTINISTVASFVVAGAGVTVAKHGNRSVSSQSGSADLLTALGVNVQGTTANTENCINKVGIGFMFAPIFHPAMKFAAKARTELGIRTIFNLLGPITNPAGVRKQLIGTFNPSVAAKLAGAMEKLTTERTCVVSSTEGLDEVALSGDTSVYEIQRKQRSRQYAVNHRDFGLPARSIASVRGGSPSENAAIAVEVLSKHSGPVRDIVVANAAFGIYVAGKAPNLQEATEKAIQSIDSGMAMTKLKSFVEYTNQ